MKSVLILMLMLQVFAFSGPVCGNHLTTAESMDCCLKGHERDGNGLRDAHSYDCCSSCDIGKNQTMKRQDNHQLVLQAHVLHFVLSEFAYGFSIDVPDIHQFSSPSPPSIFLLDCSIRI